MRRRLRNLSVFIYISFAIVDGTIVLGGGRNASGPIGDAEANSERGMGFIMDPCLFSKFIRTIIAGYVIVCSYSFGWRRGAWIVLREREFLQ